MLCTYPRSPLYPSCNSPVLANFRLKRSWPSLQARAKLSMKEILIELHRPTSQCPKNFEVKSSEWQTSVTLWHPCLYILKKKAFDLPLQTDVAELQLRSKNHENISRHPLLCDGAAIHKVPQAWKLPIYLDSAAALAFLPGALVLESRPELETKRGLSWKTTEHLWASHIFSTNWTSHIFLTNWMSLYCLVDKQAVECTLYSSRPLDPDGIEQIRLRLW